MSEKEKLELKNEIIDGLYNNYIEPESDILKMSEEIHNPTLDKIQDYFDDFDKFNNKRVINEYDYSDMSKPSDEISNYINMEKLNLISDNIIKIRDICNEVIDVMEEYTQQKEEIDLEEKRFTTRTISKPSLLDENGNVIECITYTQTFYE